MFTIRDFDTPIKRVKILFLLRKVITSRFDYPTNTYCRNLSCLQFVINCPIDRLRERRYNKRTKTQGENYVLV